MGKITKEMVDKWIKLYKSGRTMYSISREFNVSPRSVQVYLDKAGVIRQSTITTKTINEWITLYKTGNVNMSWLAEKYNVHRNTVASYLKQYGIKTSRKVPHIVEER